MNAPDLVQQLWPDILTTAAIREDQVHNPSVFAPSLQGPAHLNFAQWCRPHLLGQDASAKNKEREPQKAIEDLWLFALFQGPET